MSRITTVSHRGPFSSQADEAFEMEDSLDDTHDPATLVISPGPSTVSVHESVIFSTTFRVPAFYFSAFEEGISRGSALMKR